MGWESLSDIEWEETYFSFLSFCVERSRCWVLHLSWAKSFNRITGVGRSQGRDLGQVCRDLDTQPPVTRPESIASVCSSLRAILVSLALLLVPMWCYNEYPQWPPPSSWPHPNDTGTVGPSGGPVFRGQGCFSPSPPIQRPNMFPVSERKPRCWARACDHAAGRALFLSPLSSAGKKRPRWRQYDFREIGAISKSYAES